MWWCQVKYPAYTFTIFPFSTATHNAPSVYVSHRSDWSSILIMLPKLMVDLTIYYIPHFKWIWSLYWWLWWNQGWTVVFQLPSHLYAALTALRNSRSIFSQLLLLPSHTSSSHCATQCMYVYQPNGLVDKTPYRRLRVGCSNPGRNKQNVFKIVIPCVCMSGVR